MCLYHLDEFTNIVNFISILARTYVDMEVLALLGIHILKLYHYLLMSEDTNYSILVKAFPILYIELNVIQPSLMLKKEKCFLFFSNDLFKKWKLEKEILEELLGCCQQYSNEIVQILKLSLKKFAYGFALQKGAIFGFGEMSDKDTGSVLKKSSLSAE